MTFGEMIRKGRKNLGLTLKESADYLQGRGLNMSVGYLCDYESDRVKGIKMDFIYEAAALYGLDSDKLCIAAGRIPKDIFYKIVAYPHLYSDIRNLQVKD